MITTQKINNRWVARCNNVSSSPCLTKKKAVDDLLETERFIRISQGGLHEKDCQLGNNYLSCRACVETSKYS